MAERSVHEAAVEAMAAELYAVRYGGDAPGEDARAVAECWSFARADARAAIAALVASAEVREGLVAALYAKEGRWYVAEAAHDEDGKPIPGLRLWPLADAVLAALGGTKAPNESRATP